ncbi:methylmalonyl-CoA epimerase [Candidatus Palauibacter polyketidifaciens]|uniref:methylmalonyl-CoA epimerase n=1 Tax=Candidatus Palauibacter polyketidifaciens TaxID=3056740 RepID=UPI002382C35E|nr:methylmalonyl-CoA epimerase [Candidatus Palauibacter polyketidifaciens]MDE2719606.1 methylmalonyl-CoA epimerase [Candidatus Palauibacter polyketidifaciens]
MNQGNRTPGAPIIDHVGIAVNSLQEAVPRWSAVLGQPPSGEETVPSEGIRATFFGEGAGRIELLAPLTPESPIARFLDRRGPGIHHVCVCVDDLEVALADAEAAGAETIPPRIRVGAGGARIAFLHPRSLKGVLLEMREDPEGG